MFMKCRKCLYCSQSKTIHLDGFMFIVSWAIISVYGVHASGYRLLCSGICTDYFVQEYIYIHSLRFSYKQPEQLFYLYRKYLCMDWYEDTRRSVSDINVILATATRFRYLTWYWTYISSTGTKCQKLWSYLPDSYRTLSDNKHLDNNPTRRYISLHWNIMFRSSKSCISWIHWTPYPHYREIIACPFEFAIVSYRDELVFSGQYEKCSMFAIWSVVAQCKDLCEKRCNESSQWILRQV